VQASLTKANKSTEQRPSWKN